MADPMALDELLDTLARSDLMPDAADQAAATHLAQALRDRLYGPAGRVSRARVLLVSGPDADPIGEWLEDLQRSITDAREGLAEVGDHMEALLGEVRGRRVRLTAQRDAYRDAGARVWAAWNAAYRDAGARVWAAWNAAAGLAAPMAVHAAVGEMATALGLRNTDGADDLWAPTDADAAGEGTAE